MLGKCLNCDSIVPVNRKKYCSNDCYKKYSNLIRDRVFYKLQERCCSWCDKTYIPKVNKSIYCSRNCNAHANSYKYPIKRKARKLLGYAISSGLVIKSDHCEICFSNSNIHGHHEDYNKPLEVLWVCAKCHKGIHKKIRAEINVNR